MNDRDIVNAQDLTHTAIERALLMKIQEIFEEIDWLSELPYPKRGSADGLDARIRIGLDSGTRADLEIHVKSEMRPSTFLAWAASRRGDATRRKAVPVLALPFVSARIAELCRQEAWSWFDLAGNCWLDVPGQFRIERSGKAPVHRPPRRAANLSTAAAARVMHVLLSPAHAGRIWTQRDLQAATCSLVPHDQPISLGLVNKVLRHLRDEGYVAVGNGPGARVLDPVGLLEAWSEAYRFDRHERLSYFTLLKGSRLDEALDETGLGARGRAAFAAFSAAERQAPQVRQAKTWLYVAADVLDSSLERMQAKEVDSGENLVVLIPDDAGVFLSFDADSRVDATSLGCTDPVQTYVDLRHCGGRGDEAAKAMLEQCILGEWKAVGLA